MVLSKTCNCNRTICTKHETCAKLHKFKTFYISCSVPFKWSDVEILQGLPPHGINIFASQLHTHLTGRRVYTKHVRKGIELPEVNRDNHYSPHFQEIRQLPAPVNVRPVST